MHGLINKSLESFLRDTYGNKLWLSIMSELDFGFDTFEPMFGYDDGVISSLLDVASARLDKPRDVLLEDWGTYLVAHPSSERVRRLLRFGGVDYEDFLLSLEELPGRVRLAVPDLDFPSMEINELGDGEYALNVANGFAGAGHVFLGLLRALADDYGALVLIDFNGSTNSVDRISIQLLEAEFAEGRGFRLAQSVVG